LQADIAAVEGQLGRLLGATDGQILRACFRALAGFCHSPCSRACSAVTTTIDTDDERELAVTELNAVGDVVLKEPRAMLALADASRLALHDALGCGGVVQARLASGRRPGQ
jgi:hypothetical protein